MTYYAFDSVIAKPLYQDYDVVLQTCGSKYSQVYAFEARRVPSSRPTVPTLIEGDDIEVGCSKGWHKFTP